MAALALAIFATLAGSVAGQGSDNCCGTDGRVCSTDAEWDRGYYDRQAGLCGAPAVASVSAGAAAGQSSSAAAGDTTWILQQNCCYRSGTCGTEQEWTQGYYDFHAGVCGTVPAEMSHLAIPEHRRARGTAGQSGSLGTPGYFGGPSAFDHEGNELTATYDPTTRTTVFTNEDGDEQLRIGAPTRSQYCDAIREQELPVPPECD